jgi:hypothetical protein
MLKAKFENAQARQFQKPDEVHVGGSVNFETGKVVMHDWREGDN